MVDGLFGIGVLHCQPNGHVEGAIALLQQNVMYVLRLAGQSVVEFAGLSEVCVL